ncbi:MAG: hypothetical protein O9284_15385 [Steroidobacteraceae bacterium]|nr:hypothetical protein [Steroidobacteraceae bacterium]
MRTPASARVRARSPEARSGERLTVEQLVERADAVLRVRVELGASSTSVRVQEVVGGDPGSATPATDRLAGICLPGRGLLRDWIRRPAYFEDSVPLWRAALRRGHYEAVVFVRVGHDGLLPVCETETLLAEHWTTHRDYIAWRARLASALSEGE